jgi:predicted dehydrogenase
MDTLAASLKFASGALATYSVCFSASSAQVVESTQQPLLTIVGSKGTIRLWLHRLELITATNSGAELGSPSSNVEVFPIPTFNMGQEAVTQEVSEFVLAVQDLATPRRLYSPRHGLQDVAVIESIINASKNSAYVSVPHVL